MTQKTIISFIAIIIAIGIIFILLFAPRFNQFSVSSPQPISTTTQPNAGSVTVSSSISASTSPTSPQLNIWGEYHTDVPNALMLVDSAGRRTGKDPTTGTFYHEIPGTSYTEEGNSPNHISGELFVQNLPDGTYTLYVLGGQTGSYWVDASHYGQQDQHFSGSITVGSMVAYTQNYDTSHLASSTFSFSGTASSTASITTAPPNNLPPPPPSSHINDKDRGTRLGLEPMCKKDRKISSPVCLDTALTRAAGLGFEPR